MPLYKKKLISRGYIFYRYDNSGIVKSTCSTICRFGGYRDEDDDCYLRRIDSCINLNDFCRYLKRKIPGYKNSNFMYVIKA